MTDCYDEPIHMFVDDGAIACDTNIWDGRITRTTSDFEKVTCDECRIKYGDYVMKQQKAIIESQKEELASARCVIENLRSSHEQDMCELRRELRRATLSVGEKERKIRQLRSDINYLRGV